MKRARHDFTRLHGAIPEEYNPTTTTDTTLNLILFIIYLATLIMEATVFP
jgi:hypothetical protein